METTEIPSADAAAVARAGHEGSPGIRRRGIGTAQSAGLERFGLVSDPNVHAFLGESLVDHLRDLRVFPIQQPWHHLHLDHRGAETGKRLRQFASNGATAENHQPPR